MVYLVQYFHVDTQTYEQSEWVIHIAGRLLSNDSTVLSLLDHNPFQGRAAPRYAQQASEEHLTAAHWEFVISELSPLPQVGSWGTFQVQIQSAREQQRSTGEVVAEETHRRLLPPSKPGGAKGLLPVPELAPPPHTPQQDLRGDQCGAAAMKKGTRRTEFLASS